jgi:hypothetical protein
MQKTEYTPMTCPFCKEEDFDAIGLKLHLIMWGCEAFDAVETVQQERERLQRSAEP